MWIGRRLEEEDGAVLYIVSWNEGKQLEMKIKIEQDALLLQERPIALFVFIIGSPELVCFQQLTWTPCGSEHAINFVFNWLNIERRWLPWLADQ